MEILQQSGLALIQAFQGLSPGLDGLMHFFTFLGRTEFYLLLLPFIYWTVDKQLGIRSLLILLATDVVGSTLKLLFHQPRPYWLGSVKALGTERSYGIPSGHAYDSIAVWGYLALRLRKPWLWVLAGLLVFFIGLSRIYLGVHFPHDVVAGWLVGAVMVWIFAKTEGPLATWLRQWSMPSQVAISFAISLMIILIGQLVQALLSGTRDPALWASFAVQARTPAYSFTLGGALFGAITGYVLMKKYAPFQSQGSWIQRVGRYALGIFGVLLIYFGLRTLISSITGNESTMGYVLHYLQYAAVTFWTIFLAPLIFLRLRLADRQPA
jgi:membrane-associated phospholipid phosphatase